MLGAQSYDRALLWESPEDFSLLCYFYLLSKEKKERSENGLLACSMPSNVKLNLVKAHLLGCFQSGWEKSICRFHFC